MSDTIDGDRVFCHECAEEWPRVQHGLSCPTCHSDFVEIIEDDGQHPTHDSDSSPSWEAGLPAAFGFPRFPDRRDQAELAGNVTRREFRSPDGSISYISTTIHSPNMPHQMDDDPLGPLFRNFNAILQGVANNQRASNTQPPGQDHPQSTAQQAEIDRNGTPPGLRPRDANRPQGDARPLGNIHDILAMLQQDLHPHNSPYGAYQAQFGPGGTVGGNPLGLVAQILGLGRHEDAVYSQEELDRVISELVDQNMNGGGPMPASEEAIRSLPKKEVDKEMLGTEGKGECSICMDGVELGSEVTMLPCKHWFHEPCIAAWLAEHDTCPHCRQGIMASYIARTQAQQEQSSGQPDQNASQSPTSAPGSQRNPYVISGSPPQRSSPSHANRRSSASYGPMYAGDTSGSPPMRERRRSTRNEGQGTGLGGWMRSHFGGGSH